MERVRLYKENEPLSVMKDIENKESGVDISEYASEVINIEELHTSVNQLTFKYASDLPYASDLQRNNFIRAFTNGSYNLYIIQYVEYDTDDEILRVECDHYTTIYAGEAVPNFTLYSKDLKVSQVIQALNDSPYKSPDYTIRLDSNSHDTDTINLEDYSSGNQTVGQLWTGSGSFLRTYYGVLIIRDLQGITVINPDHQNIEKMPLTLGVNVKGLSYRLEEPERYTSAMVNLSSVPSFEVQGTGLEDTKKVYDGIANTNLANFNEMSEGDEIQVFYKGLLLCIRKTAGSLTIEPYTEPKLLQTTGTFSIDQLFHQNVKMSFDGIRVKLLQGDEGNFVTLLDEDIDETYLQGYRAYVNYENVNIDPHGQIGTKKYFGYTPKPSNGVGDDNQDVIFSQISKELYKVPVPNPHYTGRGNNTYLVDYPKPDSSLIRARDNPRGFTEAYHFYTWFLGRFRNFWASKEAKKLNQPRFNATVEIDAMTSIFGREFLNIIQFRLGDKYNVRAIKQGLDFDSEITKITYNVSQNELVSVEFGNEQDFEVEQVKNNNINSQQSRRLYSNQSKTSGVVTKRPTQSSGGGGGGFSKDEADEWIKDAIKDGKFDDEIGEWLDDALNGDDIRDDKDLFDGDLTYIKRTDDTGIPRMEWEPPYVTISTDGSESTPSKLVCYNGAEAVINEVKFKGEYKDVRLVYNGKISQDAGYLPDNEGFTIIPRGESGTGNLVFDLDSNEQFNKDTEQYDERYVTPVEFNLLKESLGYKYSLSINVTTKGTVLFETERIHLQRQLYTLARMFTQGTSYSKLTSIQISTLKDFKKHVIDVLVGKTVSYATNDSVTPIEYRTLTYYVKQVEDGELPYIIRPYRVFLAIIADQIRRTEESPLVIGGVLTIHYEITYAENGKPIFKQITSVEFDDDKLEELEHTKIIRETPGWNRLIFTQPTTKVNDQTVRVNQLLLTNGGTSTKQALINKQSVDDLWALLTPDERKEFEATYGKEWLFNLKNTPDQYDSDDILFGAFYRVKNKIKPPGIIDPFGMGARLVKQDEARAKKIAERYQQKYNYLTSKGYTVPPSHSGQVAYDRVEKHYLDQGAVEA